MIVVGAHSSGSVYSASLTEDDGAKSAFATSCYDSGLVADEVRAHYSNYGERVDISASGSIVGFQNTTVADTAGTSYATPIVTARILRDSHDIRYSTSRLQTEYSRTTILQCLHSFNIPFARVRGIKIRVMKVRICRQENDW